MGGPTLGMKAYCAGSRCHDLPRYLWHHDPAERDVEEKVTEIETALQAQLDEKHAPSKAAGLPWAG